MSNNAKRPLAQFLSDHFSSEWKLLAETERYISNTPEFPAFEQRFKEWRRRLSAASTGDTELVSVRSEIVALRKEFRHKGYDLSLGLQRLILDGFRDDSAMADGFRRVVICIADEGVFFHTGSDNHCVLGDELERTLTSGSRATNREYHFLWYLRTSRGLVLSGSATETREDFLRLEARVSANPLKLLSGLKGLT
jgi:hypothetical protein